MRKENILVVALIIIALGAFFLFNSSKMPGGGEPAGTESPDTTGINWQEYMPGLDLARQEDKPVFLYFHAQWCTYCVKLKKTTFKDKNIQAFLDENFISISVDTDYNKALTEQWQVRGLPTMWFLKPDGTKINKIPGYLDASRLLEVLEYVRSEG